MIEINDGQLNAFLKAKQFSPLTIKYMTKKIRKVVRENLTEDDIRAKYLNYSQSQRSHLRRAVRLLKELNEWSKNE